MAAPKSPLSLVFACLLGACSGKIGMGEVEGGAGASAAEADPAAGVGATAGMGNDTAGNPAGEGGARTTAGVPGSDREGGPHFVCADAAQRGHGDRRMRRLTRDELLRTLDAVLGSELMNDTAVVAAVEVIPPESPYDLIDNFQNNHIAQHARGMLALAEAIEDRVRTDPALQRAVLGECAASADRACATSFLETTALRLLRRPISATRREALLRAFEDAGGGSAGMGWLLALVLQAPEMAFHLDLRPVEQGSLQCEEPVPLVVGWDDPDAFWAPGPRVPAQQTLTEDGWYVWELPGERITRAFTTLRIELVVEGADPQAVHVNVDDLPVARDVVLNNGPNTVSAGIMLPAGQAIKVGLHVRLAEGGTMRIVGLTLDSDAAPTCEVAPTSEDMAELVQVDDWTVASRLSYALTGQGPDEPLLEAARLGLLRTEDQVRPHAERLVESAAARRHFGELLVEWLRLNEVVDPHEVIATANGLEGAGLGAEARRELVEYATYQTFEARADVTQLMSATIGFPRSERMARVLGSAVAKEDPVELSRGHGGLLLRPAVLMSGSPKSSPILRGVSVRQTLLCDVIPAPDATVVAAGLEAIEAADSTMLTNREIVSDLTGGPACAGCHSSFNGFGFALESFDPSGKWRDQELVYDEEGEVVARHAIDTRVEIQLEQGAPATFANAAELNAALSDSHKVRACIAENLYAYGRIRPIREEDGCALAAIEEALRDGGSVLDAWLQSVVGPELFVRSLRLEGE